MPDSPIVSDPPVDSATLARSYEMDRFLLRFEDASIEADYREHVVENTLGYARVSWGLLVVLVFIFAILDPVAFPDSVQAVLVARVALAILGAAMLTLSFISACRQVVAYSAPMFIVSMSAFSTFLLAQTDPSSISPYFASFFFAFCGVLITPGIGFRFALPAVAVAMAAFELVFGFWMPVSSETLLFYSVFIGSIGVIFAYVGFFVERLARQNYAISAELRDTLAEVKSLSGLLPICASCKSIRDDSGYWSQIEAYIASRSDAVFSHGICPTCAERLYPEFSGHRSSP